MEIPMVFRAMGLTEDVFDGVKNDIEQKIAVVNQAVTTTVQDFQMRLSRIEATQNLILEKLNENKTGITGADDSDVERSRGGFGVVPLTLADGRNAGSE